MGLIRPSTPFSTLSDPEATEGSLSFLGILEGLIVAEARGQCFSAKLTCPRLKQNVFHLVSTYSLHGRLPQSAGSSWAIHPKSECGSNHCSYENGLWNPNRRPPSCAGMGPTETLFFCRAWLRRWSFKPTHQLQRCFGYPQMAGLPPMFEQSRSPMITA